MSNNPQPEQYGHLNQVAGNVLCILVLFEIRRGKRIIEISKNAFLIGRDEGKCDVVLDPLDRSASREHFAVQNRSGTHFLTNLSSNGTLINGETVGSKGRRLYHGDVIEAGNSEVTFLLPGHVGKTVQQLIDDGRQRETLEPAYSIQCYALALREQPGNIECAARLLALLARHDRYEELVTGGNYFDPEKMMQLVNDTRIAIPLAKAFVKVGDFSAAMNIVNLAGGPSANCEMENLARTIEDQTAGRLLRTISDEPAESPFFQRGSLRVYVDERADFGDFRYVERYYKYIRRQIDPLFGGPIGGIAEFHITIRDQLFAQSLPGQYAILGYYSQASRRIFIKPRRWVERNAKDENFHVVLSHEYVHLRVHDACSSVLPPKWYDEGLAQLFTEEGQIADFVLLRNVRTRCHNVMKFTDDCFSPALGDPALAYLQSAAMLRYLANRFGKEALVSVLHTMGESGMSFAEAFDENLHISLNDLDREWWTLIGPVG
ncbi:MAG: FHA domain-containing protein [Candidatus Sumerlaeota bacterium]|nr:FHA domain-containing protein [Candidatus Sumerlaeota bacterium]